MDVEDLRGIVDMLRVIGSDTQRYEVKEASQKLPSSIVETLSAFANGNGGTLILGLAEKENFTPVQGFSPSSARDALVAAGEKLTPVVRLEVEILPYEGSHVVVAQIPPVADREKPCYVTDRGKYQGSFVRCGDGDRRLSPYEIDRMVEEYRPPKWDAEVVSDAGMEELDSEQLKQFVQRQRLLHPRVMERLDEESLLCNMRVADKVDGVLRPTLAGLLSFGLFPQKYFPRLVVTFARYPDARSSTGAETRFLDSRTIVGSLPVMIAETLDCVQRHMCVGAVMDGAFRKDMPDYPLIAVREAVANALQHRDYSPEGRGSAVAINMFQDQLEIVNPGGLYGGMHIGDLGKPGHTSNRNAFLSSILEATPFPGSGYVVENRGSGIVAILNALHDGNMSPANFTSSFSRFKVVFSKGRRTQEKKARCTGNQLEQAIVRILHQQPSVSIQEMVHLSGLSRAAVAARIKKLVQHGIVEPVEPRHSPRQRYRLAGR